MAQTRFRISNISPHVTHAQLATILSYLNPPTHLALHPFATHQEATVHFAHPTPAILRLSGIPLADRPLTVLPDEPLQTQQPLANPLALSQLPPRTLDGKAEEISRTVYVGNIASGTTEQHLMDVFGGCGPVAYVKMAGDLSQPTRFAFVEFAQADTVARALLLNGTVVQGRPLKVNHSKNAINKPRLLAPTLAATASLPNDIAVGKMAHQGGLAWPVLGSVNPVSPGMPSGVEAKIGELKERVEEKYKGAVDLGRKRGRSPRRSSRERRRRSRSRSASRERYGARRREDDEYYRRGARRSERDAESSWHRRHRSRSAERHRRR